MKTHIQKAITIVLIFFVGNLGAQSHWYDIRVTTEPYQNLQGAKQINTQSYLDTIAPNSSFLFNQIDTLLLSRSGGYITFTQQNIPYFYFYGAELIGGEWSYKIDTVNGLQVLKIEGKNVGFAHDFSQQDYVNVQLWVSSSYFEVHFGLRKITNPDFDFYFGQRGPAIGYKGHMLIGNAASPNVVNSDTARIVGTPTNGTVYRFTYMHESVEEVAQASVQLYPNPTANSFEVASDYPVKNITITDMMGRAIQTFETNKEFTISVETLEWPRGFYIIWVETTEGFVSKVLVKQ